ncbi:hypothetical protein H0H92_007865 [Tricholoma furcatifolium]|nr:hypothetical protein H0H92_007865 [Tricholoma furcatifolium]
MSSWLNKHRLSRDVVGSSNQHFRNDERQDVEEFRRISTPVPIADPHKFVNDFFEANQDTISLHSRNIADTGLDTGAIEDSLNGFSDSAKAIIKGLTALGYLHPFISSAVGAFSLVVTLDLSRRENDRKILAVKVQMQDLMKVFFELRHVEDPNQKGPDGLSVAERLGELVHLIAQDIKQCGSACDAYLKKGFLVSAEHAPVIAKAIKASIWESRLAEFVTTFIGHRHSLELALHVHISHNDVANEELESQGGRLQAMDKKLDMLLLFRKLDTPRERDIQKFIDAHGGAKACISDERLLEELVLKSGESISRLSGRETGRRLNDLSDFRKRLLRELQEDIDEAFSRNMAHFEKKLDMQSKQLGDFIQDETDLIINTILSGAHDRISDPDLQKIWKDMGWKGSVKARHFVLALHDFYTDQLSSIESGLPSPATPTTHRSSLLAVSKRRQDDRWALAYINAAYVQPILEAVDDDGTGFVSIKEVNTFVAERPGWQASMSHYKDKIYQLVQTMYQVLDYVLPSNRRAVDEYLFHPSFWRIELLLRSTRSVNPKVLSDPDLCKMTESYTVYEEARLDANLQDVAYELDTTATVSLVTGAGRIERYVFPLFYLLLRQHLKVMKLACSHVLDTEEFVTLNESLVSILLAVDQRIENVEAIFKQTHLDVQARLGNFAFGIFQLSYGDIKRIPAVNSFPTWTDPSGDTEAGFTLPDGDGRSLADDIPLNILKYGIQDGYSITDYYDFDKPSLDPNSELAQIEGTWTGHYCRRFGDDWVSCILRISIRLDPQPKIVGKGEDFARAFEFVGLVQSRTSYLEFNFIVDDDEERTTRTCSGRLYKDSNTITAQWQTTVNGMREDWEQPFSLSRTPPSLLRFRYTPQQFQEDPVRSRWAFACSAALHMAQERLWSRRFLEDRTRERKRYVELTRRDLIVQMGLTPQLPLTSAEKGELEYLREELHPSEARFYQALSEFEIQQLPYHPTWGCDGCQRQITGSRILCLKCMSDDLSDNIDLCTSCLNKTPTQRNFTHATSHNVLKVQHTLHDYHIVKLISAARAKIESAKTLLRGSDAGRWSLTATIMKILKILVFGLAALVSFRSILEEDTFICSECAVRNPASGSRHLSTHALLRICKTPVLGEGQSHDKHHNSLQQRLDALERRFVDSFAALEVRENERMTALEARVEARLSGIESRIDERIHGLEIILQQILAQTAALPAVYSQVARDSGKSSSVRY